MSRGLDLVSGDSIISGTIVIYDDDDKSLIHLIGNRFLEILKSNSNKSEYSFALYLEWEEVGFRVEGVNFSRSCLEISLLNKKIIADTEENYSPNFSSLKKIVQEFENLARAKDCIICKFEVGHSDSRFEEILIKRYLLRNDWFKAGDSYFKIINPRKLNRFLKIESGQELTKPNSFQ